ncbi:MAG TPA: NADH-quinone oxidoreductase subunit J [Frankiaceae bacterium]|nr:NADH-quinone oxidoreductase subunit J [Frankiaceae bacterium]
MTAPALPVPALALPPQLPAPAYLSPNLKEAVFVTLGVLVLAAGFLVVRSRVVVHAALWLVVALGALAGEYLLLTAEFVAWVQVLIYVGAVVVLMLFAAMLTRAPTGPTELDSGNRVLAAVAGLAAAATLVALLVAAFRNAYVDLDRTAGTGAGATGAAMFRTYVLPFEVVSVLLLAALIGTVILSRRDVGG